MRILLFILSFLVSDIVFAQQTVVSGEADVEKRSFHFFAAKTIDQVTPETGLTPVCQVVFPNTTTFIACLGTVSEVGAGIYRYRMAPGESSTQGLYVFKFEDPEMLTARIKILVKGEPLSIKTGR